MIRYIVGALRRWFSFYLNARTLYDVHSPFVAKLVAHVVEDTRWYYAFSLIESRRRAWQKDKTPIALKPLGAGSMVNQQPIRLAGELLRSNAVDAETGRRLFRLVTLFAPETLVELGTAQGISTAYLSLARQGTIIHTLEGNPAVADLARRHFAEIPLVNIKSATGNFSDCLPKVLDEIKTLDFLFVDGDHTAASTLSYYRQCLTRKSNNSVFVFADIHWTAEMEGAWQQLCAMPEVTLSVDLFHLGILFFNPDFKEKQHVRIVPKAWKPWRMGLWGN
jgi:predicted O-methyltransferase YrrM